MAKLLPKDEYCRMLVRQGFCNIKSRKQDAAAEFAAYGGIASMDPHERRDRKAQAKLSGRERKMYERAAEQMFAGKHPDESVIVKCSHKKVRNALTASNLHYQIETCIRIDEQMWRNCV